MHLNDIYNKVSEDTGISKDIIEKTYMAYWRAIKEHIVSIPLKNDISDEEFKTYKPNVNIPSIGKLYVSLDRYKALKKKYKNKLKNQA